MNINFDHLPVSSYAVDTSEDILVAIDNIHNQIAQLLQKWEDKKEGNPDLGQKVIPHRCRF